MLDLKVSDKNLLTVHDKMSDTDIGIYYTTPSAEDRLKYTSIMVDSIVKKKNEKEILEARNSFAKKFITGVTENSIGYDGKAISSDENKKDIYRADWFELLCKQGSHIVGRFLSEIFGDNSAYYVKEASRPFEKE